MDKMTARKIIIFDNIYSYKCKTEADNTKHKNILQQFANPDELFKGPQCVGLIILQNI